MQFDQNLIFSDAQSLIIAIGSALSDKSVPARSVGTPIMGGPLLSDMGRATELDIVGIITTALTSGGAATLQIQIVQADDAALTTNLEVLRETRAIGYASFVKGAILELGKIPPMTRAYLGLKYVVAGANVTAGVITAGLTLGVPTNNSNLVL